MRTLGGSLQERGRAPQHALERARARLLQQRGEDGVGAARERAAHGHDHGDEVPRADVGPAHDAQRAHDAAPGQVVGGGHGRGRDRERLRHPRERRRSGRGVCFQRIFASKKQEKVTKNKRTWAIASKAGKDGSPGRHGCRIP